MWGSFWLPSITLYNVDKFGLMMVERKDRKDGNFCLEIFFAFSLPALTCKIFNPVKCFSQVNDYIEPIAIFITCGLGKIFVQ